MRQVCVIVFHDLIENGEPRRTPYSTSRDEFRAFLKVIVDSGRKAMRASELSMSNQPVVVVSFDDGEETTYRIAIEELKRYRLPATMFIPSHYVDKTGYMSLRDLRNWVAAGNEIGAHGRGHLYLQTVSLEVAEKELRYSRVELEDKLRKRINTMAFPGGSETRVLREMAFRIGFEKLFTSRPEYADRFARVIGRFTILTGMKPNAIQRLLVEDDIRPFHIQRVLHRIHSIIGSKRYRNIRNSAVMIISGVLDENGRSPLLKRLAAGTLIAALGTERCRSLRRRLVKTEPK